MLNTVLFALCAGTALAAPRIPEGVFPPSGVATGGASSPTGTVAETGYHCYKGTDFPDESTWLKWDALLAINAPTLSSNSPPGLYNATLMAIQNVSSTAGVPPELVLAQVMQETGGAAGKVSDGEMSYGLLQVQPLNGEQPVTCQSSACTPAIILAMIQQGVTGHTGPGKPIAPGIAYYYNMYKNFGQSLRWYNSGQLPNPSDYGVATSKSTPSYVCDVANRLMGLSPMGFPVGQCGFPPPPTY